MDKELEAKDVSEKTAAEKEYDQAWVDADSTNKDGDGTDNENHDDPQDGLPPKKDEGEAQKSEENQDTQKISKEHGDVESVEKALKDTKIYATKLAQEKAELERKLRAFEEGKATEKEVLDAKLKLQDAKDNLDDIKARIYEDYPELKDLFDPLIDSNRALKKEITELKTKSVAETEKDQKEKALDHFNSKVKPAVLEKHKDFDSIIKDDSYWQWADEQRPALKVAALHSSDPDDIVWAISEYKKYKFSDAAKDVKTRQDQEKKQRLINAQSLRGGGTPFTGGNSSNPDDYDSAWNEAGNTLLKEGVAKR